MNFSGLFLFTDLTLVSIYQRSDDPNVKKYRAKSEIVTDRQSIQHWLTPPTGSLSSIYLYSR